MAEGKGGLGHRMRLAKMKVTKRIGAKDSDDPIFLELATNIASHRTTFEALHLALKGLSDSLDGVNMALAEVRSTATEHFGAAHVMVDLKPPWVVAVLNSLDGSQGVHERHLNSIESNVIGPLSDYLGVLDAVDGLVKDRQRAREDRDYYQKKVTQLSEKAQKDPEKDPEVLGRNEDKLKERMGNFQEVDQRVSDHLRELLNETCSSLHQPTLTALMTVKSYFQSVGDIMGGGLSEHACVSNPKQPAYRQIQSTYQTTPRTPGLKRGTFRKGSIAATSIKKGDKGRRRSPSPSTALNQPPSAPTAPAMAQSNSPLLSVNAPAPRPPGPNPFDDSPRNEPDDSAASASPPPPTTAAAANPFDQPSAENDTAPDPLPPPPPSAEAAEDSGLAGQEYIQYPPAEAGWKEEQSPPATPSDSVEGRGVSGSIFGAPPLDEGVFGKAAPNDVGESGAAEASVPATASHASVGSPAVQEQGQSPAVQEQGQSPAAQFKARALFSFERTQDDELAFTEGDTLTIIDTTADELWWKARNESGEEGMIPSNYVEAL